MNIPSARRTRDKESVKRSQCTHLAQLTSFKLTEDGEEPVLETDDRVVELQKRKSVEEGRSDV